MVSDVDEENDISLDKGEGLLNNMTDALDIEDAIQNDSDLSITSLHSNICVPVEGNIPRLPPMMQMDHISDQIENDKIDMNTTDTEFLRKYLNQQCFEGSKWSHSLIFEGSIDKQNFKEMDITQFVGNSSYKDKEGVTSYRIYFNPKKYSVSQELESMKNLPHDATLKHQIKNKFKSQSYMKLSKDLREACGTCGFNIVQNGNQKFDLKRTGLIVRNRFSCQRYMTYKKTKRDITGDREYQKYTLHNDRENQR